MLLKYSQAQKRMKLAGSGKPQRATGKFAVPKKLTGVNVMGHSRVAQDPRMMKMTSGMMNVVPRIHRKVIKNVASKRLNSTHHRIPAASKRHELRPITAVPIDPCDNSNDSGLGFDQHIDYPVPQQQPVLRFAEREVCWSEGIPSLKRQRVDIKLESDDANDNFAFQGNVPPAQATSPPQRIPENRAVVLAPSLSTQFSSVSRDGRVHLQIVCQPEAQHRARYQTEGSRGAVKDRSTTGFPVVKLVGYDKPAIIQVFIGTDQGNIVPHMFYQACRVSGKNSTPCFERIIDGTVVIEIEALPERDMTITCDCVGILKERNVDVEHRFPAGASPGRSKKKSTRCRMVFRTTVLLSDGSSQTLQATSHPIVCTQPPGVPEIGKKSLLACPAMGGLDLFILGKNFLKDTKVIFFLEEESWESIVSPDREFLQQSHLVCTVPPYKDPTIQRSVIVQLMVTSSGKSSEYHDFIYTPCTGYYNLFPFPANISPHRMPAGSSEASTSTGSPPQGGLGYRHPTLMWRSPYPSSEPGPSTSSAGEEVPQSLSQCGLTPCQSSVPMIIPEVMPQGDLKQEASESPLSSPTPKSPTKPVSNIHGTGSPDVAPPAVHQFVSEGPPLPPISVESYLTGLEAPKIDTSTVMTYSQKNLAKSEIISDVTSLSPASQLQSPPLISHCIRVRDPIHSQIMSDITRQTSTAQIHSSMMSNLSSVSDLRQSHTLMEDIQPSATRRHASSSGNGSSPELLSPTKQARFCPGMLPNSPQTIDRDITPLAPSLIMDSGSAMSFGHPLESSTSVTATRCISDMLNPSSQSSSLHQPLEPSLISGSYSLRMSGLAASSSIGQSNATERLDAIVNSAADRHMNPGQSSLPPPPPTSIISCENPHINPLLPGVQSSCPSTMITSSTVHTLLAAQPIPKIEQPPHTSATQTLHPSAGRIQDLVAHQTVSSEILASSVNIPANLPPSAQYSEQQRFPSPQEMDVGLMSEPEKPPVKKEFMLMDMSSTPCTVPTTEHDAGTTLSTSSSSSSTLDSGHTPVKKTEEGIPLGSGIQEITQMSEHDLISYINPSCFDQVE